MDQEEFTKRISEMKTDIFPLDKMLPLASVYKIFKDLYEKAPLKSTFLDNSQYKRLREGYFGLFAAAALNHWENKEHFMTFPTGPENDINILSVRDATAKIPLFNKMVLDVKEFTDDYKKPFSDFVEEKLAPKINIYSIILGSHRDINFRPLYDLVIAKNGLTTYIVTAADPIDIDWGVGVVTMFSPTIEPMQLRVSLREALPIDEGPSVIFHDKLRDRLA